MEKGAGYTAVEVEDDGGKTGIIYVYNGGVKESNLIPFGQWVKDNEKIKFLLGVNNED